MQVVFDGIILILVVSGYLFNQFIYVSVFYDIFKDFMVIIEVVFFLLVIVVVKDSFYKMFGDFFVVVKKDFDKFFYGMLGNGILVYFVGELLKYMFGMKIVLIFYKGGVLVLIVVMVGEILFSFNLFVEVIG